MNIIDLRGQGGHTDGASVLADPSGRRRRLLTGMGRIVAAVLVVWLCGLVVAGLGLLPAPIVPFASLVGLQSSPARLDRLPAPRPPSWADLQPAAPISTLVTGTHASGAPGVAGVTIGHRDGPGGRSRGGRRQASLKPVRGGFGGITGPTSLPMQSSPAQPVAGAPVQPGTAGPSGTAGTGTAGSPGKAERSGTAGRSGSVPGKSSETTATQTTTTTSTSLPGASGSAPGHTEVHSHEKAALAPKG